MRAIGISEPRDQANWAAVEEATELLQEGRHTEALIALRAVLKADTSNPYAFYFLGQGLYELAEYEAARDAYRAAIRLSPEYLGARVGLSHALRMAGDAEGALTEAKEALRRFPKDGEAMHAAGLAHAARGNRRAARQELEGFLDTNPEYEAATEVRQILESLGLGDEGEPIEFE